MNHAFAYVLVLVFSVVFGLVITQLAMLATTVYLHRYLAHGGIELRPEVRAASRIQALSRLGRGAGAYSVTDRCCSDRRFRARARASWSAVLAAFDTYPRADASMDVKRRVGLVRRPGAVQTIGS